MARQDEFYARHRNSPELVLRTIEFCLLSPNTAHAKQGVADGELEAIRQIMRERGLKARQSR